MLVDYGIFEGNELIKRGMLDIKHQEYVESSSNITIKHRLLEHSALITIEVFSGDVRLIESALDMPIHESEDWESIELAQFTLAFRCYLNA